MNGYRRCGVYIYIYMVYISYRKCGRYIYICVCVCVCIYIYIYIYIYDGILLSHIKEWNNAICSNMDGPRDYPIKWSKSEKDKYYMISLICGIKKSYKWTYLQNRNRLTDIENKLRLPTGKEGGRDKLGVWE